MKSSSVQQLIVELLQSRPMHFTAQEIYLRLKPRLPSVNPSTVYRALERLTDAGEVSVSDMGKGAMVYEMVGNSPHHHLVCQGCQQVITLENEVVQSMFNEIKDRFDFQLTTNHLILFGYCSSCQGEHKE